ncbi:PsbP-related protein (plasmid) [Streptomyces sp. NBC_01340]|uniref:hypothetical protein n=1 Tax=Streptomyces sp. NBC_01340 TaxID=2903830 RepID=UPI002E124AFD|nr:PsbP-related protein [Streptomyces sp. NBC_01340]
MSGGQRYWNEGSQRWEYDTTRPSPPPEPAVPARPESPPPVPPVPATPPGTPTDSTGQAGGPDAGWQEGAVLAPQTPQPSGNRRALWWKVAAGAAVVGVGAAFAVVKLTGGDGPATVHATASPSPAASGLASSNPATDGSRPGDSASASTSAEASVPPEGYHSVDDPDGFSMAVPDGWQRSDRSSGIFYATDGDRRLLQVFVVTEVGMSAYDAVSKSSQNLASQQPGYEEVSLQRAPNPGGASDAVGDDVARLVYAYDSKKQGERRQVVEYAFTADNGKLYAVLAAGPAAQWPQQQRDVDTALKFFATR